MKTRPARFALLFLPLLMLLLGTGIANAQNTAFTYSGRLNDNGVPVNGSTVFLFTVFDSAGGDTVIHGPLNSGPVDVVNGLFIVRIDFGANVFTGPPRWLDIQARVPGAAAFRLLTPRQEMTSAPYAIRAQTAGSLADGSLTASQLRIGGAAPVAGQFLSYSGGDLVWTDPGVAAGGIWALNDTRAYYNAGNVGIGTATPDTRLTVFTPGYGIEQTDGTRRISTYVSETGGWFGTRSPHSLNLFVDSGPSSLTIGTGGNVGIGTTSPSFKLDVRANASTAIVGISTFSGGVGVFGESSMFNGVRGVANAAAHGAVVGVHNNGGVGVLGQSTGNGVFGNSLGSGAGVYGVSAQFNGVRGVANNSAHGAVVGVHNNGGIGLYGVSSGTGVHGDSSSAAGVGGYFRNTAGGTALAVEGTARVGVLQITGGADLAEPFELSQEGIPKGSVVVIDDQQPGKLKLSTRAYDTRVAGIVSGANGVNPGISLRQVGVLDVGDEVSLSGRVYVLADASGGAIRPGDLLTTSDRPGHAMKVSDFSRCQGAVIGKAMGGLSDGTGMVLVLVTLQ